MSWRARLAEIAIAGGTLGGCGSGFAGGACNANPDPCCYAPDGTACAAQMACEAAPTVTCCQSDQSLSNACLPATCDPLADNDFDGAGPLVKTGTACGADPAIGCYGANFTSALEYSGGGSDPPDFKCDTPAPGSEMLRHGATAPGGVDVAAACAPGYTVGLVESGMGVVAKCFALCAPGEAYLGNPAAQQPNGLAPHGCNAQDAVGAFGTPASATDNGEHCVFAWRFSLTAQGVRDVPTNNTVGLCLDHTMLHYASQGGGMLDTPWPSCASQPLHGDPASHVPDAVAMGCVSSTTAGFAVAAAKLVGLPRVPALER